MAAPDTQITTNKLLLFLLLLYPETAANIDYLPLPISASPGKPIRNTFTSKEAFT